LLILIQGFGNCKKTIEKFEKEGLAGCHLEDQIAEKRCGHLDNKELSFERRNR